jgi:pyruvate formate lyase activating enzyme
MTGRVFNIQRFSLHDGPGIRTTVFLKGCTLACPWCHNPESIAAGPELAFFPDRCIACRRCFAACPTGALALVDKTRRYDRSLCRACGRCAKECYAEAIVLEGRDVAVEEVVAEVLRDRPFYENSGGGVTLSGGEPLVQAEFAAAILAACRASGVHTCLDTAAHVPWSAFETVLPHTDLVLLDLKLMDSERHRAATGAGNELILSNAHRLAAARCPIIVRVPIVAGWTDDETNLAAIADFLGNFAALDHVDLLPYHRFGEAKYQRLGREYRLKGAAPPSREHLDRLARLVAQRGIRVKISQAAWQDRGGGQDDGQAPGVASIT